jgi:hypothetical protein
MAIQARAVVADDNDASATAFARAGFQQGLIRHDLLIYRPRRGLPRPPGGVGISIRTAARAPRSACLSTAPPDGRLEAQPSDPLGTCSQVFSIAQGEGWVSGLPAPSTLSGPALLLAEDGRQPAGYAELIEVQTLLYHGLWLESISAPARKVRDRLVQEAVHIASEAGLEEVGAIVAEHDWPLRHSLLASGFRSLGAFRWFTAPLPLPEPEAPRGLGPRM